MTDLLHRVPLRVCRRWIAGGVVLSGLLLGMIIAAVGWQGWLLPVRVAESSMEPAFCGDQWLVDCPHCAVRFALDATSQTGLERVVCASCRDVFDATAHAAFRPGQRVVIERFRRWGDGPRRWEPWALREPRDRQRLLIKRVVGLPGEQISLHAGDVYVDGHIVRKSLGEWHRLAIPVTPPFVEPTEIATSTGSIGWRPDTTDSRWQPRHGEFVFFFDALREACGTSGSSASHDWLSYDPLAAVTGVPLPADTASRARLSQQFLPVPDLLLRCQLSAAPTTELAFRLESSDGTWLLTWSIDHRRLELRRDTMLVVQQRLDVRGAAGEWHVEFGRCDRQILFGLGGQQVLACDFPESDQAAAAEPRWSRLSLGAEHRACDGSRPAGVARRPL